MTEFDPKDGLFVEDIHHAFGNDIVLEGVSLHIATREILCLLGPSGCGKSTALRVIAGLEDLQRGRISVNGEVMAGDSTNVPPERRNMSLLFQDFALFPHLTVLDNVTFGLSHLPAKDRLTRANEVLGQVGMLNYATSYPHVLSGGQQQRIALARARAPRPKVMLLDEPFSNLDWRLRAQLRDVVLHVLKNSIAATLIVTHDPEEAMFMGDRIAVMHNGRIVQQGRPEELYNAPTDAFVAALFGEVNRIEGVVVDGHVATALGRVCAPDAGEGDRVEVLIRPESLHIGPVVGDAVAANVVTTRMLGGSSLIHLNVPVTDGEGLHLHARFAGKPRPTENDSVGVTLDQENIFVFPVSDRD